MSSRVIPLSLILGALALFLPSVAEGIEKPGEKLEEIGISAQLGASVDLDTVFTSSDGEELALRQLVTDGRPLIITPIYYGCPRLCGLVLEGFADAVREVGLKIGSDFRIASISFKPSEGPGLSSAAAARYHARLELNEEERKGWRFFTGGEEQIKKVMGQLGFHYLEDKGEYAHSGAIFVLTPDGKISQYFTGIMFEPGDLRLALVEASSNLIGTVLDHVMLFCFRFDPTKGKYTWVAFNVMRIGGLLTLFALGSLLFILWRKNRV